jgi:hypothetical protein
MPCVGVGNGESWLGGVGSVVIRYSRRKFFNLSVISDIGGKWLVCGSGSGGRHELEGWSRDCRWLDGVGREAAVLLGICGEESEVDDEAVTGWLSGLGGGCAGDGWSDGLGRGI